ncbi:tetratricopeptide repeat protein [Paraburkholderia nemoris]|uniref:protein O-GlcNAc transferase n=1 Tax=Paraburkholderia nemoris TaxID=2793076 RepID=A0ABM8RKV0_9BURK|nr:MULTISPECIES: glycosyltransferase family 41 protein [Paraburkholderia]MBK3811346.1 tetratricopeptide repeat protein [Paraburkholderia aspalathi]CAE6758345.1 Photosystem I assembly protein Ycf3 [Paraburkholderia nemoris]
MEITQILDLATAHHLAGEFGHARELYERALAINPDDANVMFRLGVLDMQGGAHDAALAWLDAALTRAPENARYHFVRGQVFAAAQRFTEAIDAYLQALSFEAGSTDVLFALAAALQAVGEYAAAIEIHTSLLALEPGHVDALNNLGNCHRQLGDLHAAEAAYRRAIAAQPDDANALTNLGTLLEAHGRLEEAVVQLEAAVRVAPDSPCSLVNLGVALHRRGEFVRSAALLTHALELDPVFPEAAYNLANALHALGRRSEAVSHYRRAIEQAPTHADAYNNLGIVLQESGSHEDAEHAFGAAIRLRPGFVAALNNAATLMRTLGRIAEAESHLHEALAVDPHHSVTHNNLGNVLKDQGRLDDGIDCYRRALTCDPYNVVAHSNLVYALSFQAEHPQPLLDESRRWSARHEAPYRGSREPHPNDATPSRRLRIGYVSPDFRDHCQTLFTLPLLSHHDHEQFEVFCYASVTRPDDLTQRVAAHADVWRDVRAVDDERLAQMIRDDRIDILIDLTMHMADGRPLLFARKPAPVQIAWLAYPGTTGIDAIDYRFTDPWLDPVGSDAWYSEVSIRLPHSFWCYDALTDTPEVNALPALSNGYPTFGCLNNPCKLSDATFRLWGDVMREVADARLLLMAPSGAARALLLQRLGHHGIAEERVSFTSFRPRADYLRTYHQIDVGLDTFPYNGHTTSLDSYWMGVPVVTRVGGTSVGRAGLSQLENLGLRDLAVDSDAQFVETAVQLVRDLPRLSAMRASLRARLAASPLMDGARFARHVEAAYRHVWGTWCKQGQRSSPAWRDSAAAGGMTMPGEALGGRATRVFPAVTR